MHVPVLVSLAIAALSASPISARPFPHLSSSAPDGRPLRALPRIELVHGQARSHIPEEYGAQQAAYDVLHMQRNEARGLAKSPVRAMYESEELLSREYEELERRGLSKNEKKKIGEVLDQLEGHEVSFTWGVNWAKAHNANTSKLGGFKPGSRIDSGEHPQYYVGLFESGGKQIKGSPVIQASFASEPDSIDVIVAALRAALDAA